MSEVAASPNRNANNGSNTVAIPTLNILPAAERAVEAFARDRAGGSPSTGVLKPGKNDVRQFAQWAAPGTTNSKQFGQ
jgi:hypothetical protein